MSGLDLTMARSWFGTKQLIDHVDYDVNSNAVYIGYAPAGSSDADAKWLVYKFTYDGSNRYTGSNVSAFNSIWNNRATLVYS